MIGYQVLPLPRVLPCKAQPPSSITPSPRALVHPSRPHEAPRVCTQKTAQQALVSGQVRDHLWVPGAGAPLQGSPWQAHLSPFHGNFCFDHALTWIVLPLPAYGFQ